MIDGDHEYLAQVEGDPVLLPGDQVLLFLQSNGDSVPGTYSVIVHSGSYHIVNGSVVPLETNRFPKEFGGKSLAQAVELVSEARARVGR